MDSPICACGDTITVGCMNARGCELRADGWVCGTCVLDEGDSAAAIAAHNAVVDDARFAEFQATHTADEIDQRLIEEGLGPADVRETAERFSRFMPMLFEARKRMKEAEDQRDEAYVAMEAMREMTPEREAAACARLVERGFLTTDQVLDVDRRIRAAALLMREVVCEKLWREREMWVAEHPVKSLGLRTLDPAVVAPIARTSMLGLSPTDMSGVAALVLTCVEKSGAERG